MTYDNIKILADLDYKEKVNIKFLRFMNDNYYNKIIIQIY